MNKRFSYTIPQMTRRLLRIAAPVKGLLIISTLASILGNLAQIGLMSSGALLLLASQKLIPANPALCAAAMAGCAVVIVAGRYTEGVISHAGAYRLLADMRIQLYRTLRPLAPACLIDREKGDILSIAVSDIETIEFFFAHTIGPLFTVILLPCVTLLLALHFHPLFAAVLLPVYLVVSLLFPLIAVRSGRKVGMEYRQRLGALKSMVLESVYGLRDIQIFGWGPRRLEQILRQNQQINRSAHGLTLHRQTVSSAPTFFIYLARILILAVASHLAATGSDQVAGTVILSFAATASFSSTQSLTMVVSNLLETYAAAERLFQLEDTPPAVSHPVSPKSCGPIRQVEFDRVNFSYAGQSKPVLDHFSLLLNLGDKLGIMGESGIGKSTVLRLLLRFWEPDSGQIRINGIPLEEIDPQELRRRIAVLEQDTFLFQGTIAENIAIGKPDATLTEIQTAARRAGLHDFISTLPEGYDTPMGEMGSRLSGGERQRVGIARIMLLDPDLIVMDEPTSSLDILREKELLYTLQKACSDKMLLLVSHRPSTLTGCTRLIRLEHGKAVPV